MKRLFIIIFSLLAVCSVSAQRTADIGLWGGIGSYTGDMTHVNNSSSLNPNFGLFFRYNFNSRVGLRTSAIVGTIGAEGEYEESPWDFNKFLTDLSLMGEFNFFRYIIGSERYSITTYMLGGIGASLYNYVYDPVRMSPMLYYLSPGQLAAVPVNIQNELLANREQSVVGMNIPVGFGFKFNIGKRMGVGMEAILRKYLDDTIDDLDDPRKFYVTGGTGPNGEPAGSYWQSYNSDLHNNDYTIHFGVHITYRFYSGGKECPVYENVN